MKPPHDPDAESAVIGCCLLNAEAVRWASEWLRPGDFFAPKWQFVLTAIAALHAEGQRVDALTVADRVRRLGYDSLQTSDLVAAQNDSPAPSGITRYGHIVRRHSVARAAMGLCNETLKQLSEQARDPDELLDALMADLKSIDSHVPTGKPEGYATFEELRSKPQEARAPWVLQGLFRSDWRALFVGPEGAGKTLLMRQMAVAAAAGLPVFGGTTPVLPVRTLLVDLENPEDHLIDWVDRISRHASLWKRETEGRGAVWHRPGGIDLRKRVWRGQLEEILRDHRPDLVCLGPLYKAFRRASRETEEEAAGEMQEIFDDLRTRYHFALMLEHHAPKGSQGMGRDLVPFGSSLWLRWGEIRMSLVPPDRTFPVWTMDLRPFSGSRIEHGWPEHVDRNRSSGLPWIGRWDESYEEAI